MIRLCEYICNNPLENTGNFTYGIRLPDLWQSDSVFRLKGRFTGNFTGASVLENYGDGMETRFFWVGTNIYIDICGNRAETMFDYSDGIDFDLSIGDHYIYDNLNDSYVVQGDTIGYVFSSGVLLNVSVFKFSELEIRNGGTLVFSGSAAYDDFNGHIGIYDSISDQLYYNPDFNMQKGADIGFASIDKSTFNATGGLAHISFSEEISSFSYTVSDSWINVVPLYTVREYPAKVEIEPNTGLTSRTGSITFVNSSTLEECVVVISQSAPNEMLIFADYIYTMGGYCDTGIYPDSSTTIEFDLINENHILASGYYPNYIGNSGLNLQKYGSSKEYVLFNYGDGRVGNGYTMDIWLDYKNHIEMSNSGITITNEYVNKFSAVTVTTFNATGDTIYIGGEDCFESVGEVKIYKEGNIVSDLIPFYSGYTAGFYDSVRNVYLYNEATGRTFAAISEVDSYITLGDETFDAYIGEDSVKRIYIGKKLAFLSKPFEGIKINRSATVGNQSGSTSSINVKSSEDWCITNDSSWISVSPSSGIAGEAVVTITSTEENTGSSRSCTITATTNSFSATCEVTQKSPGQNARQILYTTNDGNSLDIPQNAFGGSEVTQTYDGEKWIVESDVNILEVGDADGFNNNYTVTSVVLPEGLETIGWNAFISMHSLTSITIPNSVTTIGDGALAFDDFDTLYIGSGVESIGINAFYASSFDELYIYAQTAPSIHNENTFDGGPFNKIYYPSGSDYSTWMADTRLSETQFIQI